jgi:hypothetical protein
MRDRGTQSSRAKQSVLLNKSIHEILRDSDKLKKKKKGTISFGPEFFWSAMTYIDKVLANGSLVCFLNHRGGILNIALLGFNDLVFVGGNSVLHVH